MWGTLPTLIPSLNNTVPGMASRLEKPKDLDRLEKIGGGSRVRGKTFVWKGEVEELNRTGERFDLRDWVMGEVERSGSVDIAGYKKE